MRLASAVLTFGLALSAQVEAEPPAADAAMDLVLTVKQAIMPCWRPVVQGPHPARLAVTVLFDLNPDGSVARPPQLSADSAAQAARDPDVRAAGEAALRAVADCAPYSLPAGKYDIWKSIAITFDPQAMIQ